VGGHRAEKSERGQEKNEGSLMGHSISQDELGSAKRRRGVSHLDSE